MEKETPGDQAASLHAMMEKGSSKAPVWLFILGILFMLLWLGGAFALGAIKLMAGLMVNDSGTFSADAQANMLIMVACGQIVSGLAGIPGGFAFFRVGRRKKLWGVFVAMLVLGVLIQVASLYLFSTST